MATRKSTVQRLGDDFERRMRRFDNRLRGYSLSPEEVAALKERVESEIKRSMKLIDEMCAFWNR